MRLHAPTSVRPLVSARARRTTRSRLATASLVLLAAAAMAADVTPSEARSLSDTLPGAPNWYEVLRSAASRERRGVMMTIHGGGWTASGSATAMGMRPTAARWQARGWNVVNITHRPGAGSIDDVVAFYDAIRRRVGKGTPICALGGSSGGNLALVLATRRPLACVISDGGPSDLVRLGSQAASDGAGGSQLRGPAVVKQIALRVFGTGAGLVAASPRRVTRRITARVLLATSGGDPLISCGQDRDMATALRYRRRFVLRVCLPPGPVPFVHAGVSDAGWRDYLRYERLVARIPRRG